MPPFAIVVAADEAGGIGKNGQLPWRLEGDLAYFKRLTQEAPPGTLNAVVMGRKTWESIPDRFRPLAKRLNVVISNNPQLSLPEGVMRTSSLDEALERLHVRGELGRVFVIGGAQIYGQAIAHRDLETIYLTRVHATMNCDTCFPDLPSEFELVSKSELYFEHGLSYEFHVYLAMSHTAVHMG